MAGAFLGRMNFLCLDSLCALWLTLSYIVGAYSFWGGGLLWKLGTIDYSGGYIIHLISPRARPVFIGCSWTGPPSWPKTMKDAQPNNILTVLDRRLGIF